MTSVKGGEGANTAKLKAVNCSNALFISKCLPLPFSLGEYCKISFDRATRRALNRLPASLGLSHPSNVKTHQE